MVLEGKTMLVTGASQGIGRFLCIILGRKCGKIIGIARNAEGLQETERQAGEAGVHFNWHCADLTDTEAIERIVSQLRDTDEGIDILIHNAADVTSLPLTETPLDRIDHLVRTNVTGPLQLTKLLVPLMVGREAPTIVTISSLAGYKPNPSQTVYSITKSAVNGIARALRAELGPKGIHVMNVALSSVGTAEETGPEQVSLVRCAQKIEQGILNGETELFLSWRSKWLMRLYAFVPSLEEGMNAWRR